MDTDGGTGVAAVIITAGIAGAAITMAGATAGTTRAFSVLIESAPKLQSLVLTRFLHANRRPLRSKTLWSMIRKSGDRFSEKFMLKQRIRAG
jgi:hypothetical protein